MSEEVRYAPCYGRPGYFAGTDGTIWSARRGGRDGGAILDTMHQLKPYKNGKMWVVQIMVRPNLQRPVGVHTLVLEAFVGPRPPGMQACHFPDIDTGNNRIDNLRWGTAKENAADRTAHGNTRRGSQLSYARLTEQTVFEILQHVHERGKYRGYRVFLAKKYGVAPCTIGRVIAGLGWNHVTRPDTTVDTNTST